MLTPILMAGGSGTRLWPLSRTRQPKQLQTLFGQSMLALSARRLVRGFGPARLWVTVSAHTVAAVRRALPQVSARHYSIEPIPRGTAPALGLALIKILREDPDAVVLYANSDNFVRNEREFFRLLGLAESLCRAAPERITLLGIRPTHPDTGLGYIRMGELAARFRRRRGEDEVFSVRAFVEKPNLKLAKKFLESWEYLWNPTLIVARAENLLQKFARHLPATYDRLRRIQGALGTPREEAVTRRQFAAIEPISVDYGILEKEKNMAVIPADFGWSDVGSWRAVHEVLSKRPGATFARGPHLSVDSGNNLIIGTGGKLIATVGVRDTVIVETEDAILVCPRERSQEVKKLVEELARRKLKKYL